MEEERRLVLRVVVRTAGDRMIDAVRLDSIRWRLTAT
jgi:hypothetical protein